jgi:hypothetical protein
MPTAFECFYQGMLKLPFRQRLRRPRLSRTSQRLLLLPPPLLLLYMLLLLLLLLLLPLLFPMLLHLLLVRSARRVHNSYQTGIPSLQQPLRLIWHVKTQPTPHVPTYTHISEV